ncbi:hypothetical protein C8J56DRAFT_881716 [Mycena floridula]|nr:hypothetical protein C8J56DRAFT_881716 [Mycena floridula]
MAKCYNCSLVGHFSKDCRRPRVSMRNIELEPDSTVNELIDETDEPETQDRDIEPVDDRSDGTSEGEELEYYNGSNYGYEGDEPNESAPDARAIRVKIDSSEELAPVVLREIVEDHFRRRIDARITWYHFVPTYVGLPMTPVRNEFTRDLEEIIDRGGRITWETIFPEFTQLPSPEGPEGIQYWDDLDTNTYLNNSGNQIMDTNIEFTERERVRKDEVDCRRESDSDLPSLADDNSD